MLYSAITIYAYLLKLTPKEEKRKPKQPPCCLKRFSKGFIFGQVALVFVPSKGL